MNQENLKRLIATIKQDNAYFDMRSYISPISSVKPGNPEPLIPVPTPNLYTVDKNYCGSAACIAGYAAFMLNKHASLWGYSALAELLDISGGFAYTIATGATLVWAGYTEASLNTINSHHNLDEITKEEAIALLSSFLKEEEEKESN